jgi:enamine deaminase RidA (YjgF/YER057c/UK114 family)
MKVEQKLADLGLALPPVGPPAGNYLPAARTGNLVFLAGHGPVRADGSFITGRLGDGLSVEQGYEAARATGLALLGSLKSEIGDLDRVRRIVKVFGMVRCTPDFGEQPAVINGASDLFVELFGDAGRHARSAVGMTALPMGIAVEIEMVVEVE